jgi:hypothetical protein
VATRSAGRYSLFASVAIVASAIVAQRVGLQSGDMRKGFDGLYGLVRDGNE